MKNQIVQEAESLKNELVGWRRHMHENPEIGLHMPQTAKFIKTELDRMNIDCKVYDDSSIIEVLLGSGDKCLLLRTDMDALPISEESGETYSSVNGFMHACGHDFHAAAMLGTAKILKDHEEELAGCVKLLFQPGEEIFRGAREAIEKGILERPQVDAALAVHVNSQLDCGEIVYGEYPQASVYGFRVILKGQGTHGATPEKGINPLNAGVHLYLAFQELIANEVSAMSEAVLTIGKFTTGKVSNVIPDEAVMEGTLRTFDAEVRENLVKRLHQVIESVSNTYRTTFELEVISDVPALKCDRKLNDEVAEIIRGIDENIPLSPSFHAMGSEDFAYISQRVPCAYFGIGAGVGNASERFSQHNAKVRFNEDCLPLAVAVNSTVAMEWLKSHC